MNSSDRIVHLKLGDKIFLRLKGLIESGHLKPGDRVPSERQLARRYGVGRGVVRDAMQALARSSFISISQGTRTSVLAPDVSKLALQMHVAVESLAIQTMDYEEHLWQARVVFEKCLVRQVAINATEAQTSELYELIEQQLLTRKNASQFAFCDSNFHRAIAASCCNPILVGVANALSSVAAKCGQVDVDIEVTDHLEIVDAIAQHKPDTAEVLIERHLYRSRGRAKKYSS